MLGYQPDQSSAIWGRSSLTGTPSRGPPPLSPRPPPPSSTLIACVHHDRLITLTMLAASALGRTAARVPTHAPTHEHTSARSRAKCRACRGSIARYRKDARRGAARDATWQDPRPTLLEASTTSDENLPTLLLPRPGGSPDQHYLVPERSGCHVAPRCHVAGATTSATAWRSSSCSSGRRRGRSGPRTTSHAPRTGTATDL